MGQPLFLHSVMQEKNLGGTRLKEEFGYEIPSDHVGEFWAISAHPHGVSKVANGPYEGMGLISFIKNTGNYSVIVKSLSFLY